jgi:Na+-translocating ferredoxin:NAD+ oxidoreductase RnfG subunit
MRAIGLTALLAGAAWAVLPMAASAKELLSVKDALVGAFPAATQRTAQWVALSSNQVGRIKATSAQRRIPNVLQYYTAMTDGLVTGYAVVHAVPGKHGPIRLLVATTPELAVVRTVILSFHERRGRSIRKQSFLSQFVGKTLAGSGTQRADVDGITGATISSRAVAQGVVEALALLQSAIKRDTH